MHNNEETYKQAFFVIRMPNGEYLREVFENYDEDDNYTTTKSVLGAIKMRIATEMFYNGSALVVPKYFIDYLPPGKTEVEYYKTPEQLVAHTPATIHYVTVLTKITEQESDVYGMYTESKEVHIRYISLSTLSKLAKKEWENNDKDNRRGGSVRI